MKTKAVFLMMLFSLCLILSQSKAQTDTLKVADSSGEIGSFENPVPILMANKQVVRGLQLTLHFNTNLKFNKAIVTERTSTFQVNANADNESGILHLIITSLEGTWIDSGSGEIVNLNFDVKPDAVPGDYLLNLTYALGSDPFYEPITFEKVDGYFTVSGGVIPVELSAFYANYDRQNKLVRLTWTTLSEKDNYGFEVQRAIGSGNFSTIGFVPGQGTTSEPHFYKFEDKDVSASSINYRLKQIDISGNFQFSDVRSVRIESPVSFALEQNYPNPFSITNPHTTIGFQLPIESEIDVAIFNLLGRKVKTLISSKNSPGYHKINWDATDEWGRLVAPGIYFYRVKTPQFSKMRKLLILK